MAIKPLTGEKELLNKAARGDERAFASLFHHYYPGLGQAIYKLTESLPLTQEIVQDSFVRIWLKRETLGEIDHFSSYLFIVCRNQAFAALKKLARERRLQPVMEQQLQWEAELEELENPGDHYRALILAAVDKLPAQQKRIYELSRHDRLKYEEIAERLGLSPDTVKTQVYNAVKSIRKELGASISPAIILVLTSAIINLTQ